MAAASSVATLDDYTCSVCTKYFGDNYSRCAKISDHAMIMQVQVVSSYSLRQKLVIETLWADLNSGLQSLQSTASDLKVERLGASEIG
jgi:hypothetical protein